MESSIPGLWPSLPISSYVTLDMNIKDYLYMDMYHKQNKISKLTFLALVT